MRRAAALMVLATSACAQPSITQQHGLSYPLAMTLVCQEFSGGEYEPRPTQECTADAAGPYRLLAFVANGSTGDIAILDLASGTPIDMDPTIPGFTRLDVGTFVADIAASTDSRHVYAIDSVEETLIVLDPSTLEFEVNGLPHRPAQLAIGPDGALIVTFPEAGALARIPVDTEGKPGEPFVSEIGGDPFSVAFTPDGAVIVGHETAQYVSVLSSEGLVLEAKIGLVEACRDGLDNDGDSLIDSSDSGCRDATDLDEADDPALTPCREKGESREGCVFELPECADHVDNDGDGKTDLADAGCLDAVDDFERTDELEDPTDSPFPCNNRVDDDGDGLTDYPEDPDCFSAGSNTERGLPSSFSQVAVSPDGRWAYVAHRGLSQVIVIDLAARSRVDVTGLDDATWRRLQAARGIHGISLGAPASAIIFDERPEQPFAYVAETGSAVNRILVSDRNGPLHQVDQAEDSSVPTSCEKPTLFVGSTEVQLGLSPTVGYPHLGPLLVETIDQGTNKRRYYGIEFSDDLRCHSTETWRVVYEGALPGVDRLRARIASATEIWVLGGNLCSLGVLPGDLFVLPVIQETGCKEFVPGTTYNYLISNVWSDRIELQAESGYMFDGEEKVTAANLEPDCFKQPVKFEIRPPGQFVVLGSVTGFLHNVISTPDGCVNDPDGDPLFTGRAKAAALKEGALLDRCPVVENLPSLELATFRNPILMLNIFPACRTTPAGEFVMVDPIRDTMWRFRVLSGFVPRRLSAGRMLVDGLLAPFRDTLYLVDLAGRSVVFVDINDFLISGSVL